MSATAGNTDKKQKFIRFCEFFEADLTVKLENYLAMQTFIESNIEEKQAHFNTIYDSIDEIEDIEQYNIEFRKFDEAHGTDLFYYDSEFPNRIRYYLIIQTQVVLEKHMKGLCKRLQLFFESPFDIDDLKGNSDLERGKIYISKLCNINFRDLEPFWSFLNDMRKLRNQIVHYNGHYTLKDKEMLRLIETIPEINRLFDNVHEPMQENEEYEIEISSKTLNDRYAQNVIKFFQKLTKLIQDKI
ncbi:hypothetical protein [Flavobacterium psychrotrophum]|uniref:hypothetical protein n=1 Tax=Flavobacterium psychrotrophum TaxID=2294119 RepID=UPI000E30C670|nr:hypothetical protein [Flavobacterium psychrotrophum]